jgi:general secretion pathway protein C
LDHYLAALNVDLFGREEEPAPESKEIEVENLEATKLNITLLGTVSGVDESAVAVIQEPAKRTQSLYKIGDTIQNATIVKILRGKVILSVGGKNQVLTMEENTAGPKQTFGSRSPGSPSSLPSRPTTPASTSTITLDRTMVNEALGDVTKLLSQVRVRPHYKDGTPDGLMLTQIRPNTIFTRLGLRNGDVIQNVGGRQIGNPDDIMSFYEELRSGSPVSLEITRRGRKKNLSYRFR